MSVGNISGRAKVRGGCDIPPEFVQSEKYPSSMCQVQEKYVGDMSGDEVSHGEMSDREVSWNEK